MKAVPSTDKETGAKVVQTLNKRLLNEQGLLSEDGHGASRLRALIGDDAFCESLDEHGLLELAMCALSVGLIDDGLACLKRLTERFPTFETGWREYGEALSILGRREEVLSLHARARAKGVKIGAPFQGLGAHHEANGPKECQAQGVDEGLLPTGPFVEFRDFQEGINAYMGLFRGRDECFARQWAEKQEHGETKTGYYPVKRPLTYADIEEHIKGRKTYGIYLLGMDGRVSIGVIDCDLRKGWRDPVRSRGELAAIKAEARFVLERINEISGTWGLRCLVEFSGGKGYHVWYPVKDTIDAAAMKAALGYIAAKASKGLEFFALEVFPKQSKLSGKGFGNLVKLPLGVHRGTGRRSFFLAAGGQDLGAQLGLLRTFKPNDADVFYKISQEATSSTVKRAFSKVVEHPALSEMVREFPELKELEEGCSVLSRIISRAFRGIELSERERKVLISTLGHLPRGRDILHRLLSRSPDYDIHILNYELSRLRGSPLGCRRIHSLAGLGEGGIDCAFDLRRGEYAHPLHYCSGWKDGDRGPGRSERIESLRDAVLNLKTAIEILERYL